MPASFASASAFSEARVARSRFDRAARELNPGRLSTLAKAFRDWSASERWAGASLAAPSANLLDAVTIDPGYPAVTLDIELDWGADFLRWLPKSRYRSLSGPRGLRGWFERRRRDLLAGLQALPTGELTRRLRGIARACPRALVSFAASASARVGLGLERLSDTVVPHGPPVLSEHPAFSPSEVGREP